jgi:hypothetical protein
VLFLDAADSSRYEPIDAFHGVLPIDAKGRVRAPIGKDVLKTMSVEATPCGRT